MTTVAEINESINATVRCDRCSAATLFFAVKNSGEFLLTLCGHHTHEHEHNLIADGWEIYPVVDSTEAVVPTLEHHQD